MSEKHNWKKTGLIVGIIFLIIVSVLVAVKVFKNIRDKMILKKEQDKALNNGGGTTNPGNTGNNNTGNNNTGNTNTTGNGSTPPPPPAGTPFNQLKVGDKLFSIGVTNLYNSPSLGGAAHVLTAQNGNYVGQIIQKNAGTAKVKLYSYTGGDFGYEFYAPPKAYTVNNG